MGILRERMEADLKLRGVSRGTQAEYLRVVSSFVRFFVRSPSRLGAPEVREFMLSLVERGIAGSTQKVHLSALRFFFRVTLNRPEVVAGLVGPRCVSRQPVVLSGTEVRALLAGTRSVVYRAVLMTMYATGLRVSEACHLRPSDIDSARGVIYVRQGKGGRDRTVVLGTRLLAELRQYWCMVRPPRPGDGHECRLPREVHRGLACRVHAAAAEAPGRRRRGLSSSMPSSANCGVNTGSSTP